MSKIKLVCFDLDKTLITQESWRGLNSGLGVTEQEDMELFNAYHKGDISYAEWIAKLLTIFKKSPNANLNTIKKILSQNTISNEVKGLIEDLKSRSYIIAVISGSVNILLDMIAKDLKIKFARTTNTLVFDEVGRLQDISFNGHDEIAKLNILEEICRELGIDITECACVGDGDNDIELFRKTQHGITFKGSKIEKEAWKVVNGLMDVKDILK